MSTRPSTGRYRDRILDRNDITALISEGRKVFIVDGTVIKADAWLPFHPGGDKAVLHMVGRDATNEVRAFHSAQTQEFMKKYAIGRIQGAWTDLVPPIQKGGNLQVTPAVAAVEDQEDVHDSSSADSSGSNSPLFEPQEYADSTRRRTKQNRGLSQSSSATSLSTLAIDPATIKLGSAVENRTAQELQRDLDTYPSLDVKTQTEIIQKYRLLDQQIKDAGLYNCNYTAYAIESIRYLTLAGLAFYFLQFGWYLASAVSLGLLWHQLVFTVHDAGHMGITHDYQIDTCIGIFIADFIGGLSVCWWKHNHNVHHVVTNSAEHDPDIQHMPFFAVSHRFFDSLRSSFYDRVMDYDAVAKITLRYQHWLYYPILCFGRFNLYVLSWQYIFLGLGPRKGPARYHRYLEAVGQIFFWYWFGYLVLYKSIPTAGLRVMYLLVSHAMTMPVHAQITLSHFAMSTADLGVAESFPQRMLRTTMDVDCPAWLDFVHGGLQFQTIHHLFPRIPRHNLRACQQLVLDYCEDVGIPYAIYGFTEGSQKVIGHLGDIAKQARILAECQRSMTLSDVLDGH